MVSTLSITFMALSLFFAVLLPIILVIYLRIKIKMSVMAVLLGIFIFYLSQTVLQLQFLQLLANQAWFKALASSSLLLAIFFGISTGVFQELGRFLGMKYLMKDELEWKNGIAFGIGHGLTESILIIGSAYVNYLIYSYLINAGMFDSLVGAKLSPEAALQLKNTIMATPAIQFLLGGLERMFIMSIQIALSLVVLFGILSRELKYLGYAVLLHLLIDTPLHLLGKISSWASEIYLFLAAVVALYFVLKSKELLYNRLPLLHLPPPDQKK